MPSGEEIQRYLTGAWRLMTGRADGLAMLDLSADGFWNSFFAIVVALPVLLATWVPVTNEASGPDSPFSARLLYLAGLAFVDLATWLVPLALLAVAARPLGIADRFVPYVVASNWGSALLIWFALPVALLGLFWPQGSVVADLAGIVILLGTLFLAWRLTVTVLARGPALGSGVFFGMAVSVAILFLLHPQF